MQVLNTPFSTLLLNEEQQLTLKIKKLVSNGISNQLTSAIRDLTHKNPALIEKLGGPHTILKILKNKNVDEHSNIIKECILVSLIHHNKDKIIRCALKKCIESQYSEIDGWHRIPIRFYNPFRETTPYIEENAIKSGKSTRRTHTNQIDASWLWQNKCIYLWHRWSDSKQDIKIIQSEINTLRNTKTIIKSLYGDYDAAIICIVHGKYISTLEIPKNINFFTTPWNINKNLLTIK